MNFILSEGTLSGNGVMIDGPSNEHRGAFCSTIDERGVVSTRAINALTAIAASRSTVAPPQINQLWSCAWLPASIMYDFVNVREAIKGNSYQTREIFLSWVLRPPRIY